MCPIGWCITLVTLTLFIDISGSWGHGCFQDQLVIESSFVLVKRLVSFDLHPFEYGITVATDSRVKLIHM